MADIPYVPPGRRIKAEDFAALVAAANAKLKSIYSNAPVPLIAMNDAISFGSRRFFFCDSITPADETTIWRYFISHHIGAPWKRVYEHAPFTDFAADAVPDDGYPDVSDPDAPAVRVEAPDSGDWATRKAAIWPDGGFPSSSADILQCSLEAHRFTGGDYDDHLLYVRGCDNAEYEHVFHQAEIILGEGVASPFEWPENYNKYRLLRFSNLTPGDIVVRLPVIDEDGDFVEWHEVTVYGMSSRCVRRTTDLPRQSWTTGYEYFQLPLPDDPCVLNDPDSSALASPVDVVRQVYGAFTRSGTDYALVAPHLRFSYDNLWDINPLYCGKPSVSRPKTNFPTPEGGWFPTVDALAPVGDYIFHKGKMLVVSPAGGLTITRVPSQSATMSGTEMTVTLRTAAGTSARGVEGLTVANEDGDIPAGSDPTANWVLENIDPGGPDDHWEITFYVQPGYISDGDALTISFKHLDEDSRATLDFTGFATLVDDLDAVGITVTDGPPGNEKQLLLSSDTTKDLIGLSTNFVLGAFGSPGVEVSDTTPDGGALMPYLFGVGLGVIARWNVSLEEGTLSDSYKTYTVTDPDDWSTYAFDEDIALEVDTTRYSAVPNVGKDFKLTDSISDVLDDLGPSGDFDYGENDFGISFIFTAFGPALRHAFHLPMAYPWSTESIYGDYYKNNQGYATINGDGSSTPFTFDIEVYDFLESRLYRGGAATGAGWPTPDKPISHYPRTRRITSNIRTNDEPTNVLNQSQPTTERPSVKSYYENKPWKDGVPLPLTTNVESGGQISKRLIAILQQVSDAAFDVYARLSAWVGFEVVPYKTSTGATLAFDCSAGSYSQASYYADARTTLLSPIGTPKGEDSAMGLNSPVMTADNYNTLASIINGLKKRNGSDFRSSAQYILFDNLAVPLRLGRGLGPRNYRPRAQFIAWADGEPLYPGGPDMTDYMISLGFPIKDSSHFQDFADAMTDDVTWYSPPDITTSPDGSTTTSIRDMWFPYHGFTEDDVTNYRWVTITDAIGFYESLGMTFVMEELACPATFQISVGSPSLAANGDLAHAVPLTLRPCVLTCINWFNDPDGQWLYTPENDVIRNETPPTDRPVIAASNQDGSSSYGIYDPGFSNEVCERLYFNGANPTNPAAAQIANHTFLYRRYGGPAAKSVVWARNYFRIPTGFSGDSTNATARIVKDLGLFHYNVKEERNDLDGGSPEINDLPEDENLITTGYENGEIFIIHTGTALD